jgi:diacylglycerol O-acyltransferase
MDNWRDLGVDWSCADVVKEVQVANTDRWEEIEGLISRLYTTKFEYLNTGVPLWRLYVIDGFESKQVLFWMMHHALGDGASLGAALTVTLADDFPPSVLEEATKGPGVLAIAKLIVWLLLGWMVVFLRWAYYTFFYQPAPKMFAEATLTGAKQLCCSLGGIASVRSVKTLGKTGKVNATVNDVVLTAVARAMGKLTGEPDKSLPIAVPMNLRLPGESPLELQNRFGSLTMFLPLADPEAQSFVATMKRVASVTRGAKRWPEAFVGAGLLLSTGRILPVSWQRWLFDWLCSKIKCAISNVTGVPAGLRYGGVLCELMSAFVPPPSSVPLGIAITSYRDQIYVSVLADAAVLPEPRRLLNLIIFEMRNAVRDIEKS